MCLGIPGRVIEVRDEGGLAMGRVDFGGVRKEACLAYVPDVRVGDYVIIHVGFAISRVDEEEALRTLELLDQMGSLVQQELATMGPGMLAPAVVDAGTGGSYAVAARATSSPAGSPPGGGPATPGAGS